MVGDDDVGFVVFSLEHKSDRIEVVYECGIYVLKRSSAAYIASSIDVGSAVSVVLVPLGR